MTDDLLTDDAGGRAPDSATAAGSARAPDLSRWHTLPVGVWIAACSLISILAYMRQQVRPSAYDALEYLTAGRQLLEGGLFSDWAFSELRSYAYPLFVGGLQRVANVLALDPLGVVFLAQLALHVCACLLLRRSLMPRSPRAAGYATALLLVNPVLVVFLPELLTESVTVSLTVLLLAAVVAAETSASFHPLWWSAAALAAGTAVVVRPANIVLVGVVAVAFVVSARTAQVVHGARYRRLAAAALVVAVAAAVPLLPQLHLNRTVYDTASVFPVRDVGAMQFVGGVKYLKYVTVMSEASPRGYYENPFLDPGESPSPRTYYLDNPVEGAAKLAISAASSLTPDYLFPYVYDLRPGYRLPLLVASQALVAAGLLALALALRRAAPWRRTRQRLGPLWSALTVAVVLNLGLNSVAAVETRFGFISVVALSVAAAHLPELLSSLGPRQRRLAVTSGAVYAASSVALAYWVLRQAVFL